MKGKGAYVYMQENPTPREGTFDDGVLSDLKKGPIQHASKPGCFSGTESAVRMAIARLRIRGWPIKTIPMEGGVEYRLGKRWPKEVGDD